MTYQVTEIFTSIQGEGFFTGAPCNFVRLAGCNLACEFCDTNNQRHYELTELDIVKRLNADIDIVVVTGGEPTLQDIEPLVALLHQWGWKVHLETNGTRCLPPREYLRWVAMAPKPDTHIACGLVDEVKWLIPEWTYPEIQWQYGTHHFLQPVNWITSVNKRSLQVCLDILYTERPPKPLRLSVQLHKLIGVR